MFAACGDRVVCTGCYSGATDSHELLGYFDFAALLLVGCILRRSNNAADLRCENLLCYSQHQSAFAAAAAAAAEPTWSTCSDNNNGWHTQFAVNRFVVALVPSIVVHKSGRQRCLQLRETTRIAARIADC